MTFAFVYSLSSIAQLTIPNGSFETWANRTDTCGSGPVTFEFPQSWEPGSNSSTFFSYSCKIPVQKTTDKFAGSFAIQLNVDTFKFFGSPTVVSGDAEMIFPFSAIPKSLTGYYKFLPDTSGERFYIGVLFSKNGSYIGAGSYEDTNIVSSYKQFSAPLSLPSIPDTVKITIINGKHAKTTLYLDELAFSMTTGINDKNINTNYSVSPNPAGNYITVMTNSFLNNSNVGIYDLTGRLIITKQIISPSVQLDIHSLPIGIYILKVQDKGGVFTQKIIKE